MPISIADRFAAARAGMRRSFDSAFPYADFLDREARAKSFSDIARYRGERGTTSSNAEFASVVPALRVLRVTRVAAMSGSVRT